MTWLRLVLQIRSWFTSRLVALLLLNRLKLFRRSLIFIGLNRRLFIVLTLVMKSLIARLILGISISVRLCLTRFALFFIMSWVRDVVRVLVTLIRIRPVLRTLPWNVYVSVLLILFLFKRRMALYGISISCLLRRVTWILAVVLTTTCRGLRLVRMCTLLKLVMRVPRLNWRCLIMLRVLNSCHPSIRVA